MAAANRAAVETRVSPHPDAVKRRQEAEIRRQRRTLSLRRQETLREVSPSDLPANVVYVVAMQDVKPAVDAVLADESRLSVVFFSAPYCPACKAMYPKFRQIATNNPDVRFVQVNVEDDSLRSWCQEVLGLDRLPYWHLYRGAERVAHFSAGLTKVSVLRAEIAAHKPCLDHFCRTN